MATASTIIVYHNGDGTISISRSMHPGVSKLGHIVQRYRVHGSRPQNLDATKDHFCLAASSQWRDGPW
jgi:hypothetical protein